MLSLRQVSIVRSSALRFIIPLILVLFAGQAHAGIKLYADARLGAGGVRHSELDFYPTFGSFSAGFFMFENIGIEGFVDTSLTSGNKNIFDLSITEASGVALRLQSPPEQGLQAYVLIGYVDFTLSQDEEGELGQRTVVQSFEGLRLSVGIQQHLEFVDGFIFGVEYRNYYADSGITVDGVSVGLRFEMP